MTSTDINATVKAGDPGPVPDILKRAPVPAPVRVEPVEPLHLATPDLVRAINAEYEVILGSERANLPRALVIAEKLNALRARTIRGQWKVKFDAFNLKISYQTASNYLRVWEHWGEIEEMARSKSTDPVLLTIDGALELWARRNDTEEEDDTDTEDDAGGGKPSAEAMVAKQTENAEAEAAALMAGVGMKKSVGWLVNQEPHVVFEVLTEGYPLDGLSSIRTTELIECFAIGANASLCRVKSRAGSAARTVMIAITLTLEGRQQQRIGRSNG
jgi:hypothetical protein